MIPGLNHSRDAIISQMLHFNRSMCPAHRYLPFMGKPRGMGLDDKHHEQPISDRDQKV